MLARALLLGALLVALTGCALQTFEGNYTCTDPDKGHVGPNGRPDPCHDQDTDTVPRCDKGEYVHWKFPWEPPALLWFGTTDQPPECPLGPTTISYEGKTDLVAPVACEACACEPSTGTCALPSTLTVSSAVCGKAGAPISFDAPIPWDGHCDKSTQIPQGVAYSLTIDPITTMENGCAPGPPVAAKVVSLHWNTFARACDVRMPEGPVPRSICLPSDPLPSGFQLCIFYNGEHACPDDEPGNIFTEQHVFYQGVEDDRQCSACTCGPPTGSACTATISTYKGGDLTCDDSAKFAQIPISSAGKVCTDIALPGQSLGSKLAGPTTYLPGTCQPLGGDASGGVTKIEPATLCCRP